MNTAVTVEGTGLHPATASCLEAMQWLQGRHECRNILDIGCGNGILSLTASALWGAQVLATDIAPEAISDTQRQCEQYGLSHTVTVLRCDGFNDPQIKQRAPYELIMCNLLAEPIIQWAPMMHAHLARNGVCMLAGILAWLAPQVQATYLQVGFEKLHTIEHSPWTAYLFRRT